MTKAGEAARNNRVEPPTPERVATVAPNIHPPTRPKVVRVTSDSRAEPRLALSATWMMSQIRQADVQPAGEATYSDTEQPKAPEHLCGPRGPGADTLQC